MQMHLSFDRCVELGSEIVVANDGLKVLSPFAVLFSGEDLPCDVDLVGEIQDGLAVCSSLLLKRKEGGDAISAETLRAISVPRLVSLASVFATSIDQEDLDLGKRTFEKQDRIAASLRRRKHRITTELLTEVAEIYLKAEASGEWPVQAIHQQKNVSVSTAATWVGLARKHNPPLIPPATSKRGSKS